MRSYRVSKSTSIITATTTSVSVSGGSQPELLAGQRQQGSFAGLSTTVHTPESTYIPAAERYAGLRLLAEVSTLQADPFVALATQQAVTFDDEVQEQSASSLSLPDEPSQATDDVDPIMMVAEPHETGISQDPKYSGGQNLADQNTDSTDKWIMYSGDETRPFKCGYEGCGKTYFKKHDLQRHFVSHIGDLQFRCYTGDCTGAIRYCDKQALARHIHKKHTQERPYECDICNKRFLYSPNLSTHRRKVHSVKNKQNQSQNSDPNNRWIVLTGDKNKPFKCGYEGCYRHYTIKQALKRHFVTHTGNSRFRCYLGECNGKIHYRDRHFLNRHIRTKHTFEKPFQCDICERRFGRKDHLKSHKKNMHGNEEEKKPPKRKKK